ncbi:MAG TPA: HAD family hydrolase [Leucothrix mucor]|nr:HAD family hydrolase [Leucothrix mucor]
MMIKCITFDLDDTLWACKPVIIKAEKVCYQWIKKYYPKISSAYSYEKLIENRIQYMRSHADDAFDLSKIRLDWLAQLADEFSYEQQMAADAFHVFWLARNQVSLFDGTLDVLEQLSKHYSLGVISNGNADVNHIGIGQYFDFSASVADAGVAKPDAKIFHDAVKLSGSNSCEVVHIGDHPVYDVMGALNAGLHAIWYNPKQSDWSEEKPPSATITHLNEIETQIARIIAPSN